MGLIKLDWPEFGELLTVAIDKTGPEVFLSWKKVSKKPSRNAMNNNM